MKSFTMWLCTFRTPDGSQCAVTRTVCVSLSPCRKWGLHKNRSPFTTAGLSRQRPKKNY